MASASIKNIFIKIWRIACITLSLSYLLASASAFIPPESFSPITFFALAFPIFLICQLIFCIIAFFIQRKLAFVMILIIPFGYYNFGNTVALHSKQWQPVKKDSSLRIMTWNVESFVDLSAQSYPKSAARVQMLKLIQQYDPDVLCLQEYKSVEGGKRRISAQKELDSIGYKYHFCSNDVVIKTNKRVVSGGVAFFSKLPLFDSGKVKIRTKVINESIANVDVLLNNKPLRIYTAHLASFELSSVTYDEYTADENVYRATIKTKGSVQHKLTKTEVLHQQQVNLINDIINKSPYSKIYCGDINTTPVSYNYRILKGNMQDAFLVKGSGIGATYYKISPTLRIDVCLVDTSLNILQCSVAEKKLSDHYPVITDVCWK